jgi:hypothetical protein
MEIIIPADEENNYFLLHLVRKWINFVFHGQKKEPGKDQ